MPRARLLLAWLLVFLALAGTPALAAYPARPAGPVLDQANILAPAEEAALDTRLRAYNQRTGRAVIVATLASLDGMDVADYAQGLAETWDIGGAESEEGALLVVAPTERKIRIHTGRGVQDRLTDAWSGRIIRDTMAPRFRENQYGAGIAAAVEQIEAQLDRTPADAKAVAEAAAAAARQQPRQAEASFGGAMFWVLLILFFMFAFGRRRRGARHSGIDPGIVLWGASAIANQLGNRGGGSGWGGWSGGGSGGGGFGGFGGGGSGFDGGGASGDW
jgi:uncharacterized protein